MRWRRIGDPHLAVPVKTRATERVLPMDKTNIAEIKRRADIRDVWAALDGGKLRGNRGQAFWRKGDGFSVSLDADRGLWYDFVSAEGGNVFDLVEVATKCSFREAAEWLARHTGVGESCRTHRAEATADWRSDLRAATWWRMAAVILAEDVLASLSPNDLARRGLTAFLQTIRLGDAALVAEYRWWRKHLPHLTAGMIRAGQRSDARVQRRLALWLRSFLDETA